MQTSNFGVVIESALDYFCKQAGHSVTRELGRNVVYTLKRNCLFATDACTLHV